MTTTHPFDTSRESILALWSPAAQTRRSLPESQVSDLFVLLHGMLFTNIQLDDFQPTLSRFLERLQIEGVEERDWIMMGIINIASLFEYGRTTAVLYPICGFTGSAAAQQKLRLAKKEERKDSDRMEVDDGDDVKMIAADSVSDSPKMKEATVEDDLPVHLRLSLQLVLSMLAQALKKPTRKSLLHGDTLNPYIVIILTFLSTVMKSEFSPIFERAVPWKELADFLSTVPRKIIRSETKSGRDFALLTSGCSPLPEDACIRGMAWGGRKIYERGFWTKSETNHAESDVLDREEMEEPVDGIIEDEDDADGKKSPADDVKNRWVRVFRAGTKIAKYIDGLSCVPEESGKRTWKVEGALATKVSRWQEQERIERQEEEMRRIRKRWDDSMDIDEAADLGSGSDDDEEDEEDSQEVRDLKVSAILLFLPLY
jgi:protein SMG6